MAISNIGNKYESGLVRIRHFRPESREKGLLNGENFGKNMKKTIILGGSNRIKWGRRRGTSDLIK